MNTPLAEIQLDLHNGTRGVQCVDTLSQIVGAFSGGKQSQSLSSRAPELSLT